MKKLSILKQYDFINKKDIVIIYNENLKCFIVVSTIQFETSNCTNRRKLIMNIVLKMTQMRTM